MPGIIGQHDNEVEQREKIKAVFSVLDGNHLEMYF